MTPLPSSPNDLLDFLQHEHPFVVEALDRYGVDATGKPSRAELVLRILRDWLTSNGYLAPDPTGDLSDGDVGQDPF